MNTLIHRLLAISLIILTIGCLPSKRPIKPSSRMVSGPEAAGIWVGGTGMLFGDEHAFFFTAPDGWLLDNKSGVNQGLYMVFYPTAFTWANSPVIAYGRTSGKDGDIQSVQDQVERTVAEFRAHGNPDYVSKKGTPIDLPDGKRVHVYYFEGDQWGNYEAAGYIEEKDTINFLVFNARKKETFERYLGDFKQMLQSYKNAYKPEQEVDEKKFASMVKMAKEYDSTVEGRKYRSLVIKNFGQSMANFMKQCTSYAPKGETKYFDLIFRIESNGEVSETYVKPLTALTICFERLVANSTHPPHSFGSFPVHIKMVITDNEE